MRYVVRGPIQGGYEWFVIVDTQSPIRPNFELATFSIHMLDAEQEAIELCKRLNRAHYTSIHL